MSDCTLMALAYLVRMVPRTYSSQVSLETMWLERISGLIHFLGVDNELGLVFAFISG